MMDDSSASRIFSRGAGIGARTRRCSTIFARVAARWIFVPLGRQWRWDWRHPVQSARAFGRAMLPADTRKALAAAPVDLFDAFYAKQKEPLACLVSS